MECENFGRCGSCVSNAPYDEQLRAKKERISAQFAPFYTGDIKTFASSETGFRSRAEFGVYREGERLHFTMRGADNERIFVKHCAIVDSKISNFMSEILPILQSDEILKFKLFGAEFIATKTDFLCVLLYHRNVDEISQNLADLSVRLGVNLIARSRGKKLVYGHEILKDELCINGHKYAYNFEAGAFIQPNHDVNEKMISWALDVVSHSLCEPKDLLEMYCGHGNFTIPLSAKFRSVLANEISKNSIKNALINCELNGVQNIKFIRMDSNDLMGAFAGAREYNRLSGVDLCAYEISHILVDPPRAGLSGSVIKFLQKHENIVYISCNPDTLAQNLSVICKTHEVRRFAIFDQFTHTNHVECGVMLSKKAK